MGYIMASARKQLKIVSVIIFCIFITSGNCHSAELANNTDDREYIQRVLLQDTNIVGKVIDIIKSEGSIYIKLKTNSDTIWLEIINAKLVKGKTYEFYPPYSVKYDYKVNNINKTFDKLYASHGLVNNKYSDTSQFSFKGIYVGMPYPEVINNLNKLTIKYTENKSRVNIFDFELGLLKVDVTFTFDHHYKLCSYSFEYDLNNNDTKSAKEVIEYIANVFKSKYNLNGNCKSISELNENSERFNYCGWSFGDIAISATYLNANNSKKVMGIVMSPTRVAQTYNTTAMALALKYEELIKSEEKRLKYLTDESIKSGVNSF